MQNNISIKTAIPGYQTSNEEIGKKSKTRFVDPTMVTHT